MPYNSAHVSKFAVAMTTGLVLAACGSEAPDTVQNPTAPAGVASSASPSNAPPPEQRSAPGSSAPSSSLPASSDGTLVAMVESAIAAEPELNTLGIEVTAEDGTVYLRGQARTRESRRLATEVASSVDGVKRVENELFVTTGAERSQRRLGDLAVLR